MRNAIPNILGESYPGIYDGLNTSGLTKHGDRLLPYGVKPDEVEALDKAIDIVNDTIHRATSAMPGVKSYIGNEKESVKNFNVLDISKYDKEKYVNDGSRRYNQMLDIRKHLEVAKRVSQNNVNTTVVDMNLVKRTVNFENLFLSDMLDKKGFVIDTHIQYADQGDGMIDLKEVASIYSYRFGVNPKEDPPSVIEKRYTCSCDDPTNIGENIHEVGIKCPVCGSYAIERKCVRGWICLNDFKVFNPDMLANLMANKRVKNKGGISFPTSNKSKSSSSKDSYPWLGDKNFKYNILELQDPNILVEFIEAVAAPEYLDRFLSMKDDFMTSKIPVINKSMRHHRSKISIDGTPKVESHASNTEYILISQHTDELNRETSKYLSATRKRSLLYSINESMVELRDIILVQIGGDKSKDLRDKVGGRRKGSSTNLVVEGIAGSYVTFECTLPFFAFGIMFIDWHRDLYVKHGMTPDSEFRIRSMLPDKSDRVMLNAVLLELQDVGLASVLVIREPVIYPTSVQGMYIGGLTLHGACGITDISLGFCFKGDRDGDNAQFIALSPAVRRSIFFSFNGRTAAYEVIAGTTAPGFELEESIYFIVYRLFTNNLNLPDILVDNTTAKRLSSTLPSNDSINKRVLTHYSMEMYDQSVFKKKDEDEYILYS